MAIFTIGALLLGGFLTYFTISALATLVHWISIAGAFLVFAGLTYNIISQGWFEFLGFDSELLETLSAGVLSAAAAFISFKLFEAVFATLGWGVLLLTLILVAASVVFGGATVVSVLGNLIGGVFEAMGGE